HSRVKILTKINDPQTGVPVEKPEESKISEPEANTDHAFVLKKTIEDKSSSAEDSSEIDIISIDLWELLREHLKDYPYHIFQDSPVTLYSPYEAIVSRWDVLQAASTEVGTNTQAREDLKLLLDTISGGSSGDPRLDKYFKVRDTYTKEKAIKFEDLWTIFPPGTLVFGKPFQNEPQVFIVQDSTRAWPDKLAYPQRLASWQLNCWTYDWTGSKFQRTPFVIVFEPYEGLKPIIALPYYPFERHLERNTIEKQLVARGKEFYRLCTANEASRLFIYRGNSIFGKKGFSGMIQADDDDDRSSRTLTWDHDFHARQNSPARQSQTSTKNSSYVDSRVMVDYLSYFQYGPPTANNGVLEPSEMNPDCACSNCQDNEGLAMRYRARFDTDRAQKNWEDEQYLLCPPRVLGYILKEKQWAQLQVNLIQDIPDKGDPDDAWNSRLRLADGDRTKNMLLDLVSSHISSSKTGEASERGLEVDDIIPGKGKGLVILLYGPPGVGKTSTAETIAVAAKKPLFSISVADVGTKAKNVESNLSRIFALATSWHAILLIDEADVFLESRGRGSGTSSTDKNALVSVFLRVLEYYQGIMFLTTNQIAQFDVAIPSRIHFAVQYESLKTAQMEQIFKGFLKPLDDKGLVDDYEEILDWLEEDVYNIQFDGRKIRNIVTTALGLARAETKRGQGKGKLGKKHLKAAVQNARSFKAESFRQYERYKNSQDEMIK
ncbi:P-loop containing nucleoside triphosphate hydrolase protein, partial [Aspergillus campestris IBT 28561]